jgi:hypothetical protein
MRLFVRLRRLVRIELSVTRFCSKSCPAVWRGSKRTTSDNRKYGMHPWRAGMCVRGFLFKVEASLARCRIVACCYDLPGDVWISFVSLAYRNVRQGFFDLRPALRSEVRESLAEFTCVLPILVHDSGRKRCGF